VTSISIVAFIVAAMAAVRSTWSPCGVSMLSTITPLAEQSRGRRYGVTATWFVSGGLAGGLALGALSAIGAAVVSAISPSRSVVATVAVLGALVAASVDGGLVGPRLPHHRRQVNELWLDRYRGWVYGAGFGGQIGFGLATFIMTAAVYLTVLLGALTGRPIIALAVGATFGLVRGLAVLASAKLTTPDLLRVFHQRFEAWRAPVARWTLVVECVGAIVLASWGSRLAGIFTAVVVLLAVASVRTRRGGRRAARAMSNSAPAAPSSVSAVPDWSPGLR
jgi:hypothetical protein